MTDESLILSGIGTGRNGARQVGSMLGYKPVPHGNFPDAVLPVEISFTRASTGMELVNGLWQSAAINMPRRYNDAYLNEPAATNLITRSTAFSNAAWTKQNSGTTFTLTDNFATAPDGTLTACKYEFTAMDSAGKYFSIYQAPTVANGTYTSGIWMKGAVGGEKVYIYGSLLASTTLITLTTDWVCYSVTATLTAGAKPFVIGGEFGISGMTTLPAATIYLWNAQTETGSVATSPIITAGSAVTRSIDSPILTNASSIIGQTEGCIFLDINFIADSTQASFMISDGTNYIYIQKFSNNQFYCGVFQGSFVGSITSGAYSTGRVKIAFGYILNSLVLYINGSLIGTDLSSTIPACDRILLYTDVSGALQYNEVKLFKSKPSNSELAALTTL